MSYKLWFALNILKVDLIFSSFKPYFTKLMCILMFLSNQPHTVLHSLLQYKYSLEHRDCCKERSQSECSPLSQCMCVCTHRPDSHTASNRALHSEFGRFTAALVGVIKMFSFTHPPFSPKNSKPLMIHYFSA